MCFTISKSWTSIPRLPESTWLYRVIRIVRQSKPLAACSTSIREARGRVASPCPLPSRRSSWPATRSGRVSMRSARCRLGQLDRLPVVAKLGAERPRELGEAVEDRASLLRPGEARSAAAVAGVLPAERDWRQLDRAQGQLSIRAAFVAQRWHDRFPVAAVGREAGLVGLRALLIDLSRRQIGFGAEALVAVGRDLGDQLVLADEVAQAVEDRLALVELQPAQQMRAMADHEIGACIDHRARKGADELGRHLLRSKLLVRG